MTCGSDAQTETPEMLAKRNEERKKRGMKTVRARGDLGGQTADVIGNGHDMIGKGSY